METKLPRWARSNERIKLWIAHVNNEDILNADWFKQTKGKSTREFTKRLAGDICKKKGLVVKLPFGMIRKTDGD